LHSGAAARAPAFGPQRRVEISTSNGIGSPLGAAVSGNMCTGCVPTIAAGEKVSVVDVEESPHDKLAAWLSIRPDEDGSNPSKSGSTRPVAWCDWCAKLADGWKGSSDGAGQSSDDDDDDDEEVDRLGAI
jgi:hypothetical protein